MITTNQLGRRNLTEEQKSFLRGKRYLAEKKAEGGRADRDFSGGQNDLPKTADRLAKEYNGLKLEMRLAKERMQEGGKTAGRGRSQQGKADLPYPISKGQARDAVGKAAGVSGRPLPSPLLINWGIFVTHGLQSSALIMRQNRGYCVK